MIPITRIRLLTFFLVLFAASVAASADPLEEARQHFNEAQVLYNQGKYAEAAKKFEAAHDAKPYPQFLFNIGASYEKAKRYSKAVRYYEKYLSKVPGAKDKVDIQKRVTVLKKEIERIKSAADKTPSKEVKSLREVKLQGVVVIRSTPPGATIWLDTKKSEPIGITPWEGSIEGRHVIYVQLEGHSPAQDVIEPGKSNRIRDVRFVLTKFEEKAENYLGLLKVKSNIPGAQVFIDDKKAGAYGRTPFQKQLDEGKHKIWVAAPGYKTFYKEINIVKTKVHEIDAQLKGSPVGYMNFRGQGIEEATISMDGKELCKRGPCRVPVKQGKHKFTVSREDYKSYTREFNVQPKTETQFITELAPEPSRVDAIVTWTLAAALAGGAAYVHLSYVPKLADRRDEKFSACSNLMNGCPDPAMADPQAYRDAYDAYDSAKFKHKAWRIGAFVGYGVAASVGGLALYYTFRDKGEPSTGKVDTRALQVKPVVGWGYGGVGIGGTF